MKTLSLDTTGAYLIMAVSDGARLVARSRLYAPGAHSELIVSKASELIRAAGFTPRDIEKIAAVAGPGSFTGIRIGLAFARTVAETLDIPAVSISSFDAMALTAADAAGVPSDGILVLIDDLARSVHWAAYDPSGQKKIAGPGLDTIEAVAARFASGEPVAGKKRAKWALAGSALGDLSVRKVLAECFYGCPEDRVKSLSDKSFWAPSPSALASLAAARRGGPGRKTLRPLYLKEVYLRK